MQGRRGQGATGEAIARSYLEQAGFLLVGQNVTYRVGELDLVMEDGSCLVFVEVRSRASRTGPRAEDTVTFPKQVRLTRAATLFLQHYRGRCRWARFDVVAVDLAAGRVSAHHRAAFEAAEPGAYSTPRW